MSPGDRFLEALDREVGEMDARVCSCNACLRMSSATFADVAREIHAIALFAGPYAVEVESIRFVQREAPTLRSELRQSIRRAVLPGESWIPWVLWLGASIVAVPVNAIARRFSRRDLPERLNRYDPIDGRFEVKTRIK